MGFHFGRSLAENEIVSVVSFREGWGGNTWVPRERYSLMMSFWVVPDNCAARNALLVGHGHIKGEQPGGGRVDGHGGVHGGERDVFKKGPHVADMGDGNAHLANFAAGQEMVGVIAGLGWQVEGYGKAGLAFFEIGAEQPVAFSRGGMAGIGAKQPGLVGCRARRHSGFHFAMQYGSTVVFVAQPWRRLAVTGRVRA